jgi:GNAT superfamily N-acetyltransferase
MAGFRIETYDRRYLDGMAALWNAETACEPQIAPLDPDRFVALVEGKSYFDATGLFVAREGDQVVGWVHACIAAGSEPWQDPTKRVPRIRMLIYPRERLKVGSALVAEATECLKGSGETQFLAMHARAGYPFYRGLWMGGEPMCPATLPHLHLAFEVGGYKNTQESIFLVAEMPSPPNQVATPADVILADSRAEMRHEPMRESWVGFAPMRTRALIGGEEVGGIGWVLQPHLDRLAAPGVNIWSLGVKEQHRRRGIASALVAHVMVQGYGMGARSASVATQLWNAPAHATYAKLGFRPYTILVGRTLDLAQPKAE